VLSDMTIKSDMRTYLLFTKQRTSSLDASYRSSSRTLIHIMSLGSTAFQNHSDSKGRREPVIWAMSPSISMTVHIRGTTWWLEEWRPEVRRLLHGEHAMGTYGLCSVFPYSQSINTLQSWKRLYGTLSSNLLTYT
jgi:hypothetical protein